MEMNNLRVKPFYIQHEDWMTDQEVQRVLDNAVSVGVTRCRGVAGLDKEADYPFTPSIWRYFVVDGENNTRCFDNVVYFGKDAVLLTLDQVDEHLGLTKPESVTNLVTNTPKSLANVKLDCRKPDGSIDEELSRAFQEACFEQGIGWEDEFENIEIQEGCYFLYTGHEMLLYSDENDRTDFEAEPETEIKFTYERKLVWDYEIVAKEEPVERKVVTIGGVEYYEDMIAPMLEDMQSAKVVSGDNVVSPMAGSGNPPDKKDN
jgi:hypothetical protein